MNNFLQFTEEQRRSLITQVSTKLGLPAQAVEKDWWVTLVLEALFSLPMREHFIFKGGTSLSKGWKLIERFSEDIDIALSPEAFGRVYKTTPAQNYVKDLKREGCVYTSTVIKEALDKQLMKMGVAEGTVQIEAEEVSPIQRDKDPQTLFVRFSSLFTPGGYMLDPVKVEFGVRGLRDPFSKVEIQSILGGQTESPAYNEKPFEVMAVEPRKTFMEKMILLHEKYQRGIEPDAGERQSRHLYDLYLMSKKGIAQQAIADKALYQILIQHRAHYVRLKGIDYTKMQLHTLKIIPPPELHDFFRNDYNAMREQMMYGDDVPDFDTINLELISLSILLLDSFTFSESKPFCGASNFE